MYIINGDIMKFKLDLKKMIIVNSILTFILCFLTHFLYTWLPNPMFSILFPVNESIWEHMKMIYTTILLYGIIEAFIMKKFKIIHNNFLISTLLKAVICIPIDLIIYLPILKIFGEHMIVTFIILFISILISNIIGYFILKLNEIKYEKTISIIAIILIYVVMGILTYKPLKYDLFYDRVEQKYGINDYEPRK